MEIGFFSSNLLGVFLEVKNNRQSNFNGNKKLIIEHKNPTINLGTNIAVSSAKQILYAALDMVTAITDAIRVFTATP